MHPVPIRALIQSSKVECPGYDGYWEKHADESSFLQREHRTEFSAFNKPQRNPTVAQRHNWPGCIIMEDSEKNELVVPRISLLALQQLNYLDFVKSVLQANSLWIISPFTMEELWAAVVTKIYHFENTLEKELKIGEVQSAKALSINIKVFADSMFDY